MVQVESSNVATVGWDARSEVMTVEFKDVARYEYGEASGDTAARIVFCELLDPRDFVRMSLMPARSRTIRMPPLATIPVPGLAGFNKTRAAPKRPITSCGIVPATTGTLTMSFLESSVALRIASATSPAFPRPTPT